MGLNTPTLRPLKYQVAADQLAAEVSPGRITSKAARVVTLNQNVSVPSDALSCAMVSP